MEVTELGSFPPEGNGRSQCAMLLTVQIIQQGISHVHLYVFYFQVKIWCFSSTAIFYIIKTLTIFLLSKTQIK